MQFRNSPEWKQEFGAANNVGSWIWNSYVGNSKAAAISCRCFLDSCPISRTGRTKLTDNAHFIIINDYLSIA